MNPLDVAPNAASVHNGRPRINALLARVDELIGIAEGFVLAWGIILMAANTIANVFGRYLFSRSLYFTEELNAFLIVILTFIGLGYVTRKGRHIRMSALYDALPPRYRKRLMILISVTTAVAMFVLAWFALEYVIKIAHRGRVTPALQVPLYLTYIWVVIGFAVTGVQYLLTAWRNTDLSNPDVYVSYSTVDEYQDPEIAEVMHLYDQDHPAITDTPEADPARGHR